MAVRRQTNRPRANWLSAAFGALAVLLAIAAAYLFFREDRGEERAPPSALEGENELVHVQQALEAEGLEVASVPRGVPVGELSVPGQGLTVDGARLYVFRYTDDGTPQAELAAADPAAVLPARSATGTPIADGVPFVTSHSNVTVALVGGSPELQEKVERAIQGLP